MLKCIYCDYECHSPKSLYYHYINEHKISAYKSACFVDHALKKKRAGGK